MNFAPSYRILKSRSLSIQGWPVLSPEPQDYNSRPEAAAKVSLGESHETGVAAVAKLGVCLQSGSITMSPDIDNASPGLIADTFNVSDRHGGDVSVLTFLQSNWAKALHPPMEKVRGEKRPHHRPKNQLPLDYSVLT
jgi:hypothetical protein